MALSGITPTCLSFFTNYMKMAWSSNSGICGTDRITCMALTKQLVYAPREQALTEIKREVDKCPFRHSKRD